MNDSDIQVSTARQRCALPEIGSSGKCAHIGAHFSHLSLVYTAERPTKILCMTSATHPHLRRTDNILLIAIAAATIIVHLLTGSRYGFHRDELQLLDDARHIDWGFVAYPPVTPLFARISLALFGTSLVGFRFFAMVTEALAVII